MTSFDDLNLNIVGAYKVALEAQVSNSLLFFPPMTEEQREEGRRLVAIREANEAIEWAKASKRLKRVRELLEGFPEYVRERLLDEYRPESDGWD